MRMIAILLGFVAGLAAFLLPSYAPAFAQSAAALSGNVSSAREGPMEGVVVSARKDGSTITVSVISDDKGHFSFPAVAARSRPLRDQHSRRRSTISTVPATPGSRPAATTRSTSSSSRRKTSARS